jgi:hypothetical protein
MRWREILARTIVLIASNSPFRIERGPDEKTAKGRIVGNTEVMYRRPTVGGRRSSAVGGLSAITEVAGRRSTGGDRACRAVTLEPDPCVQNAVQRVPAPDALPLR